MRLSSRCRHVVLRVIETASGREHARLDAMGDPILDQGIGVPGREDISMEITKVRELGDAELRDEARKAAEQRFRIRFQMKLGQTEGVKRLRVLKQDIARFKTIERERALGIHGAKPVVAQAAPAKKGRKAKAGVEEAS